MRGRSSTGVWTRYCGTAAKAGGKQRTQTSPCSSGRLLPTRREVYRARDTKLDRDVAIKVLPEEFANDDERLARFEREAKLLASLNHPNIASIYGLEESDGVKALVLELVEGPTLAERIADGPIPVEEVLPIARQIAEALEAGHEAGVIHRDLKPANVKVREDGTVKVLDYGLAKALEGDTPSGAASDLSRSPTLTRYGTQIGVILGTAAYMSPEQAKGKRVDRRTDIWAFGAVVYEMLTGKRAFAGEDVSDTLAAVFRAELEWNDLPAETPASVRRLLRRSLEREPKKRLRSMGDAALEIEEALVDDTAPYQAVSASTKRTVPVAIAVALVTGLAVWGLTRGAPAPSLGVKRFVAPAGFGSLLESGLGIAISPTADHLVYTAPGDSGRRLYLRPIDAFEAMPIRGTDGARSPFFSPEGEWIGFFAKGQLKKVNISGGPSVTLCRCNGQYGNWSAADRILFSQLGVLYDVPASGGEPRPLTPNVGRDGFLVHATKNATRR